MIVVVAATFFGHVARDVKKTIIPARVAEPGGAELAKDRPLVAAGDWLRTHGESLAAREADGPRILTSATNELHYLSRLRALHPETAISKETERFSVQPDYVLMESEDGNWPAVRKAIALDGGRLMKQAMGEACEPLELWQVSWPTGG
jgi:hypothetical protein